MILSTADKQDEWEFKGQEEDGGSLLKRGVGGSSKRVGGRSQRGRGLPNGWTGRPRQTTGGGGQQHTACHQDFMPGSRMPFIDVFAFFGQFHRNAILLYFRDSMQS